MKLHIQATGFELDRELEKYVDGKVSQLYKELPRKLRADANCDIAFRQSGRGSSKASTCKVTVMLDGVTFQAEESTQHMYAALDIAVVHVVHQLEGHLVEQGYKQRRGEWRLP